MRNIFGELLNDNEVYATNPEQWGRNSDGGVYTKWDWSQQFLVPIYRGKVIKGSESSSIISSFLTKDQTSANGNDRSPNWQPLYER